MRNRKNEKGYTLLEYCAGAAIILGVLYGALNALGTDLQNLLGSMGGWANNRQGQIEGAG